MKEEDIKKEVRKGYARVATRESSCCIPESICCEGGGGEISTKIGYSENELSSIPEGADLGLGCGNPVAMASLVKGETVLDLGSGAGLDSFLAANIVGKEGKVIGVDMTPEMIRKARENARKGNFENVEFRTGEIENIPADDNSVDVVISNCVINLSPDKKKVFKEAYRILKKGGRLMVSDLVILKELPDLIKSSIEAYIGCLSGAILKDEYISAIEQAGFREVEILEESYYPVELMANDPTANAIIENFNIPEEMIKDVASSIVSIKVRGIK